MIEIINQQKNVPIGPSQRYLDFGDEIRLHLPAIQNSTITIAFVSEKRIRQLNRDFRGLDSTTDVLSFPFGDDEDLLHIPSTDSPPTHLGDIIICAEQARKQAAENNLDLFTEIRQLILHGFLHLCGFDHETDNGEMNAKELILRDKLEIN